MRITGGVHGSRKLESPKSDTVRPTSDKVRQAIFNMLASRDVLNGAIVIDAFSGTGALGLEALSRGADFCTFLDKNKNSYELTKTNIATLKEEERSKVLLQDSVRVKQKPDDILSATLVFLDPPYHKNLIGKATETLFHGGWLSEDTVFVIEAAQDENITHPFFSIEDVKKYGDTKVMIGYLNNVSVN